MNQIGSGGVNPALSFTSKSAPGKNEQAAAAPGDSSQLSVRGNENVSKLNEVLGFNTQTLTSHQDGVLVASHTLAEGTENSGGNENGGTEGKPDESPTE